MGQESAYLLGHHDNDCGSKLEVFAKTKFSCCYRIADLDFVAFAHGGFKMLMKSTLYFLDIVKDFTFLSRLSEANDAYRSRFTPFLFLGYGALFLSELANMTDRWSDSIREKNNDILVRNIQVVRLFEQV